MLHAHLLQVSWIDVFGSYPWEERKMCLLIYFVGSPDELPVGRSRVVLFIDECQLILVEVVSEGFHTVRSVEKEKDPQHNVRLIERSDIEPALLQRNVQIFGQLLIA